MLQQLVKRSGLRLTPWKQDTFQRVARSVVKTPVFTSVVPASTEYWIAVQTVADEPISEETPYFTDLTFTRDPA